MKKVYLVMLVTLACTNLMQAQSNWIDVHFTRDSVMWKDAFPALVVNGLNLQSSPNPDGEYLGFLCNGAFGRFAVSDYSYTPLNVEDQNERFIYAFRLHNNTSSHWTFPQVQNVGKIKVNFLCGNSVDAGEFTLQKYVSDNWVEFEPVIKFVAPAHAYSTTSFVVEKELNLTEPVTLRFKGPTLKNVHVYSITISKNSTVSGINENDIDRIHLHLVDRTLQINNLDADFRAVVYNLAGIRIASIQNGEIINFRSPGYYIVKVSTAEKTITKKIVVP